MIGSIDWSSPDSLTVAYRDAEQLCQRIVQKCESREPLTVREVMALAQWIGIAQGAMHERAGQLERRPQSRQGAVMAFYTERAREAQRTAGEERVLESMRAVPQATLEHWAKGEDMPLRQLVASAELFRRGLGPDPAAPAEPSSDVNWSGSRSRRGRAMTIASEHAPRCVQCQESVSHAALALSVRFGAPTRCGGTFCERLDTALQRALRSMSTPTPRPVDSTIMRAQKLLERCRRELEALGCPLPELFDDIDALTSQNAVEPTP